MVKDRTTDQAERQKKKRSLPERQESDDNDVSRRRMPKRAAACTDFKERSPFRISRKADTTETKKQKIVEDESVALHLTASVHGDEPRPTRRLTDFTFHDTDGNPQPVELLEFEDIFIAGLVLPQDESLDKEKAVRCQSFGRVETWNISGYEEGSPIVWISTELADYDCLKPAKLYKKIYQYFLEKASSSLAVYKRLCKSAGGNPDTSLDELLAAVARSMLNGGSKLFSDGSAIQDFVKFQGEFIYNQLAGLDETAKQNEARFVEIPVLVALRDASSSKKEEAVQIEGNKDIKYAKVLQDEEYRKSIQGPRKNRSSGSTSASASDKFYIKINEDEIADDYPLPSFYKNTEAEADEFIIVSEEYVAVGSDGLAHMKLHNWALYNCDSRLISLELLPMKPCADIDATVFGSGVVEYDDDKTLDTSAQSKGGIPIFLSQIKEWMIEYGSGTVSVSIRTDLAWYRLMKPSKQYAPWHEPVLKTARVAISILRLLEEQTRLARLSFQNAVKRMSEVDKDDVAYISSDPSAVETYVVVHGQIILQIFSKFPNKDIIKCQFVTDLASKMEARHHTKWLIKKNKGLQRRRIQEGKNLNPRACMPPKASKKQAMQATTTRLINRIWGELYFNYAPEGPLQEAGAEIEEDEFEEEGENEEDDAEDTESEPEETLPEEPVEAQKPHVPPPKKIRSSSGEMGIRWDGEILGNTSAGEPLYRQALVGDETVAVGGAFFLDVGETPAIYFVEYMFESSDHCKILHGRLLQRGSETVLRNTANERELFLTNKCMTVQLKDIKGTVPFEIRSRPWGHQYRKENATADKLDMARADERKAKDLPTEYFCRSLYSPERGGFFTLPLSDMGLGSGSCNSCRTREDEKERSKVKLNDSKTGFSYNESEYLTEDYVYVSPHFIAPDGLKKGNRKFKAGRNIELKAFVVCQLLDIIIPNESRYGSFEVHVRRFYRPEDISAEKAYTSDIQEVYYSDDTYLLPPEAIEGKCEVREKKDMPLPREFPISGNIFFCEHFYSSSNGSLNEMPVNVKPKFSTVKDDDTLLKKQKGKEVESESDEKPKEMRLATLDIFAGCGGLTYGLDQAGATETKWAIEFEEPAGKAFKQNHPETTVIVENCNVILRAIMEKCGDQDDCVSTEMANELAAKLDEELKRTLPLPGQVDFINGGPPCQGFSSMNRYQEEYKSKVQRQMILAFLSFADYYRPKYFLLENVRAFVSFNKGQTFRLTLASLLEMGYQVRFGVLEAGAYGLSQSRKRVFVYAAAPEEVLPEWPEPMHVFSSPETKIPLGEGSRYAYAAVRSTRRGAPFRSITVRDAIGDLPPIENGDSEINKEYGDDPVSWFQKEIRGDMMVLTDHICKEMNEQNLTRCKKIPKRPGADWRDLPNEKLKLTNGLWEDMIPQCLPKKANLHNGYKGLYGRLDWQGNFPTSTTDPQPTGFVGMCFHPDQDRIVSVRECARSQGFPDSYVFSGRATHKHRQIGNAVPPPLAFALGRKLKEALHLKKPLQHQP